jgi:hypothetical protein
MIIIYIIVLRSGDFIFLKWLQVDPLVLYEWAEKHTHIVVKRYTGHRIRITILWTQSTIIII